MSNFSKNSTYDPSRVHSFILSKPIIIISGKRKAGKDYFAEKLAGELVTLNINIQICRIAQPIKRYYAYENNLDFEEMLKSSNYKEGYREKMVSWAEKIRLNDGPYFLIEALNQIHDSTQLIIISDMRRKNDLNFLLQNWERTRLYHILIMAPDDVRVERGWVFTNGIDNAPTECDLDSYNNFDNKLDPSFLENQVNIVNLAILLRDSFFK